MVRGSAPRWVLVAVAFGACGQVAPPPDPGPSTTVGPPASPGPSPTAGPSATPGSPVINNPAPTPKPLPAGVSVLGWMRDVVAVAATDGATYIGGTFGGEMDLDPSENVDRHGLAGDYGFATAVLRLRADGSYDWGRDFQGVGETSWVRIATIAGAADGGVFVAGTFIGQLDVDPGPAIDLRTSNSIERQIAGVLTTGQTFLVKLSAAGALVWAATLPCAVAQGCLSTPAALAVMKDGGVAMSGMYDVGALRFDAGPGHPTHPTETDPYGLGRAYGADFLVRLTNEGALGWAATFAQTGERCSSFTPYRMMVTGDDALLINGSMGYTCDLAPRGGDVRTSPGTELPIVRFDAAGAYEGSRMLASVADLTLSSDGDFLVVAGYPADRNPARVSKLGPDLTRLWEAELPNRWAEHIRAAPGGGAIVTGRIVVDGKIKAFASGLDSEGREIWTKALGDTTTVIHALAVGAATVTLVGTDYLGKGVIPDPDPFIPKDDIFIARFPL